MPPLDPKTFQSLTGLTFRNQGLLARALTHPSYTNEHPKEKRQDNERLEFLGDAVIDFLSGEWLYECFPDATEGRLTRLRAALVRTEQLAQFAIECRIGEALLLGKGEEDNGGRGRPGNLCAVFEALIGALYLDQGMESVRTFCIPFFKPALDAIISHELDRDPKSILQEWTQANMGITPSYQLVASTGPDHAKEFTVAVFIGDRRYADGTGLNKQSAAQVAAQRTLELLQSE